MDPDRSLALAIGLLLAMLVQLLWYGLGRAGMMTDDEEPLGADASAMGMVAANSFAGCLAAFWLALDQWGWAALAALLAGILGPICYALGAAAFAAKKALPKPVAAAACFLGKIFSTPAKALFAAARLSAASPVTEEDILDLVEDVQEEGLDENQKEMISGVFELDDTEAGELMTHRTDIKAVEDTDSVADAILLAKEYGFSRLPVFRKNLDDIVGILRVKELLGLSTEEAKTVPVTDFVRPAMFVPESCRARELLLDFKQKHTQIAIVVDEYGGTAGIVTMEDILEEIVGNIQDEFDREEEEIRPVDGGFVIEGSADLEDVFERFGLPEPERQPDEDFDSVGGMILQKLGRFPAPGAQVQVYFGGLQFEVLRSGERRIESVLCRPIQPQPEPNEDSKE